MVVIFIKIINILIMAGRRLTETPKFIKSQHRHITDSK